MHRCLLPVCVLSLTLLVIVAAGSCVAQEAEDHFYRGYYLQQKGQLKAALAEYKQALVAEGNVAIQQRVFEQLDMITESIAAADMSRLMPADTIVYMEISQPGARIEQLAATMGLVGRKQNKEDRVLLPLDDGLVLPSDFQISPALLGELKKISGVAMAITGFDHEREEPQGVVVIHAGNSDLIRGLIETGVQVIPQEESISGCQTFCIDDEMWFVKKGSLLVGSDQPDQIRGVLSRLEGDGDSLASLARFQKTREEHSSALAFAYLDGPRLMKHVGPDMDNEAAVARVVLGLDLLQHMTATINTTETGAVAKIQCQFKEGHQGLAYGLLRTVPLSDDVLQRIPAGVAMVAALGVNPQLVEMASDAELPAELSALDIGRELFANIKDVGLFVLPTVASQEEEVPEFGIAVTANDAIKSERLWNQLLSLPAKLEVDEGLAVNEVKIAGHTAQKYSCPDEDAPDLFVLRLDDTTMLMGTEAAVSVAVATADGQHPSLAEDEALAPLVAARSDYTAKAVFIHVGRMLKLVAQLQGGADADELELVSRVMNETRIALTSEEAPSQLTLRAEASGLPLFEEIIKSVAAAEHGHEESHVAQAAE